MSQLQLELENLKIQHFFEVCKTEALRTHTGNTTIPVPQFRLNSEDSPRIIEAIRAALDRAYSTLNKTANSEPDSTDPNL